MSYTDYDFPHTHFYETDLRELLAKVGSYDKVIQELNNWIETNTPKIDEILAFMKSLEEGNLPEGLKSAIYEWATKNLMPIIAEAIKMVFFGITDDGYFVAYIPENWEDINFATSGYDYNITGYDYGHLILLY